MNKRLLSILLVLCMVLVSVPVFAFSATAATPETKMYEYTSSFSENLPTVSADGTSITYNGNWTALLYKKENWGGSATYTAADRYGVMDTPDSVPMSGFFSTSWCNGNSGAAINACAANHGNHAPALWTFTSGQQSSAVLRYTAEKSGIVDIIFDKVGNISAAADFDVSNFRYGVFVNNVMVYPVEGGTLHDVPALDVGGKSGAEQYLTNVVAATNIKINAGDTIQFVVENVVQKNADGTYKHPSWGGAGNVMFGTVAYVKETEYTTSFNSTTNLPSVVNGQVVTSGNWTPMTYSYKNYQMISSWKMNAQAASNVWSQYDQYSIWASGVSGGYDNPTMNIVGQNGTGTSYWAYKGQVAVVNRSTAGETLGAGVRYTAEKSGTVNITFDMLGLYASKGGDYTKYRYGIYLNGQLVWPTGVGSGSLFDAPALTQAQNENLTALSDITVKAGDKIDFVCIKSYTSGYENADKGHGNVLFPTIKYTDIADAIVYDSAFSDNLPTVSADGASISYNGNWEAFAYDKETWGGAGLYDGTDWKYKPMNTPGSVPLAGYFEPDHSAFQGNAGAGINASASHANHAPVKWSFTTGNECSAVLRYTAEKTGIVTIILDQVGNVASHADCDVSHFRYGVFVNGVKVWPAEGETLRETAALNVNGASGANQYATDVVAATGIQVSEGDRIEFVCEQILGNNVSIPSWGGAGNVMFGRINYTQVMEAPTASATISVGAVVNASAKITMPKSVWFPAETGLYVNGKKISGETAKILESIAIKDIETTKVTVQPYYTTTQGAEVKGSAYEVSVAGLLKDKLSGDPKAQAVLNYAAAAQKYFNVAGGTLAYTPATVEGNYEDNLKVINKIEGARVVPQQVALLLKDTVSFKFTVDGALEGDVMQISDGVNEPIAVEIVDGVAVFDNIAVNNWDTVYTFAVLDAEGNAVSSSFTYSVSTYYVRMMANSTDASLTNLVTAMMALYETTL